MNRAQPGPARGESGATMVKGEGVALLRMTGLVDERFEGFPDIPNDVRALMIDLGGMTRMSSFGVRQWLKAMNGIPRTVSEMYFLGCPTFFVDQLNMVVNFAGIGKVLTAAAPYGCLACGHESSEMIDVMVDRQRLIAGNVPDRTCGRCGNVLEFDEAPESYFSFVQKYAATSIVPEAAALLQAQKLYWAPDLGSDKPPKIFKLVHGSVTYFRIAGPIGRQFRARPLIVGAEGEVVIDLAEVDEFSAAGQREWDRLMRAFSKQVQSITLIDVGTPVLQAAKHGYLQLNRPLVWSVLATLRCASCGKESKESVRAAWPLRVKPGVCPACAASAVCAWPDALLATLRSGVAEEVSEATHQVIERRQELYSRAVIEANVVSSRDTPTHTTPADDDAVLGKYKIIRRLGIGGMAEVFLAKQVGIGGFEKPVALKRILRTMLENSKLAVDMFLNEAKVAARLSHANIVQMLDVGEERGSLFLAMEYVHGKDLRHVLKALYDRRRRLALAEAMFIAHEVASALQHAYFGTDLSGKQHSVIHRDVSPHNVLLSFDGTVKLADFGVALSSIASDVDHTVGGKWSYMSPEQNAGEPVGHSSDVFSLGVVVYQLCTGRLPFPGSKPKEVVARVRRGQYTAMRDIVPDVPERMERLVAAMLSTDAGVRPTAAGQVADAISVIATESNLVLRPSGVAALLTELFPGEAPLSLTEEDLVVLEVAHGDGATDVDAFSAASLSPTLVNDSPSGSRSIRRGGSHSVPIRELPNPMELRSKVTVVGLVVAAVVLFVLVVGLFLGLT